MSSKETLIRILGVLGFASVVSGCCAARVQKSPEQEQKPERGIKEEVRSVLMYGAPYRPYREIEKSDE